VQRISSYVAQVQRKSSEILAKKLKRLRGDYGQREFAIRIGIEPSQLNRLEQGTLNTTLKTIDQLCRGLKCTPAELFFDDSSRKKS
jgi:transcriptional regulator with XRE-family HTH domain